MEYIIEVVQCGSINKAAQNLYLSQPNLSNSIKALERELGFQIFIRKNSGIELTPEGTEFLKYANRIHVEMEKIKNIPSLFQKYRDLSITSTYSSLFLQIFMSYRNLHPIEDIQDTFKETGLIQIFRDMLEQKYRLSIFYCFECRKDFHQQKANSYDLDMIPLYEHVPIEILVSIKHPLAKQSSLDFDSIKDYPIITYEDFKYEDWLSVLQIDETQKVTKIFDRGGLSETISNSNAIAIIKKGSIDTQTKGGCTTVSVDGQPPFLDIYLLKQKNYQLNSREKEFIRFFKKHLAVFYHDCQQ
jgi:DNA-binding transcriptional LysR family regulator